MIHVLLSTVLCFVPVYSGTYTVDITAKYLHEHPQGRDYVFHSVQTVTAGSTGLTITAEGWPWWIRASVPGKPVVNCYSHGAIHAEGFESGNTGAWSYTHN